MEDKKVRFEKMYQEQFAKAVKYVDMKIQDVDTAQDLVHEAFLACYRNIDTYDEEKSSMETWVYVAINNRLKNYYRDRKQNSDIDEMAEYLSDGRESEAEEAVYLQECRDSLAFALDELPERNRQIVIMSYFQNMSSREIGDILGLSEGNVRIILSRSLTKMKKSLNSINWNGAE